MISIAEEIWQSCFHVPISIIILILRTNCCLFSPHRMKNFLLLIFFIIIILFNSSFVIVHCTNGMMKINVWCLWLWWFWMWGRTTKVALVMLSFRMMDWQRAAGNNCTRLWWANYFYYCHRSLADRLWITFPLSGKMKKMNLNWKGKQHCVTFFNWHSKLKQLSAN